MSIGQGPGRSKVGAAARQPGWWYPWLFVAAFGIVIAVNGVMIKLAIGSFSGLSTENAYERGLDYNDTLAAARAQDEMGWQVAFEAVPGGQDAAAGRTVAVEARFLDREGRPLTGLSVRALLLRPAAAGHDVELALAERGGGRYVGDAALPFAGQWELRVVARGDDDVSWQSSRRIQLP